MKKNMFSKALFLFCTGAVLAGCSEDELPNGRPAVPGEEIRFGISAGTTTRTVYGDVNEGKDKIAINWLLGDQVEIACPQAAQAKKVTYKVTGTIQDGKFDSNQGASFATELERVGNVGLQWGTEDMHQFYATYPSQAELQEANIGATMEMDAEGMQCYLPIEQNYKEKKTEGNTTILEPDMRYAFMVAQTNHSAASGSEVSLQFKPVVTALEFELDASCEDVNKEITITDVRLWSADNITDIAGNFTYKFADKSLTETNSQPSTSIMMSTGGVKMVANSGQKLQFTFFLLPTQNIAKGNLKLTVTYTVVEQGITYTRNRTATVNKEIPARQKLFFKNLSMAVQSGIVGTNWFSEINDNAYLHQLSIPMAGNAFSVLSDNGYYREQVSDYETLWNQGVRGFELTTAETKDEGVSSLGDVHFVCGEKIFNASKYASDNYHFRNATSATLDEAVKRLIALRNSNTLFKDEPIVLLFHYHPVNGTIKANVYLPQLLAYLDKLVAEGTVTLEDFVQVNNQSLAGDLKGKIAVIVRPGDDDYSNEAVDFNTVFSTSSNDWKTHLTVISNWGTAYDRWDIRYQNATREATWQKDGSKIRVEDYLFGISSSSSSFVPKSDFKDFASSGLIERTDGVEALKHTTNAGNAYVQEWARVVPTDSHYNGPLYTSNSTSWWVLENVYRYLWVKWPSSIDKKEEHIKSLLDHMVSTGESKEGNFGINVLSGYYITDKHEEESQNRPAITPFMKDFEWKETISHSITPLGQGNGGNYAGLAADLNCYLYNYLTSPDYKAGPLGLIQIDYINASASDFTKYSGGELFKHTAAQAAEASGKLVELIWKNNLHFIPAQKPGTSTGGGDEPGVPDSDEPVSFRNTPADKSKPIK